MIFRLPLMTVIRFYIYLAKIQSGKLPGGGIGVVVSGKDAYSFA